MNNIKMSSDLVKLLEKADLLRENFSRIPWGIIHTDASGFWVDKHMVNPRREPIGKIIDKIDKDVRKIIKLNTQINVSIARNKKVKYNEGRRKQRRILYNRIQANCVAVEPLIIFELLRT